MKNLSILAVIAVSFPFLVNARMTVVSSQIRVETVRAVPLPQMLESNEHFYTLTLSQGKFMAHSQIDEDAFCKLRISKLTTRAGKFNIAAINLKLHYSKGTKRSPRRSSLWDRLTTWNITPFDWGEAIYDAGQSDPSLVCTHPGRIGHLSLVEIQNIVGTKFLLTNINRFENPLNENEIVEFFPEDSEDDFMMSDDMINQYEVRSWDTGDRVRIATEI